MNDSLHGHYIEPPPVSTRSDKELLLKQMEVRNAALEKKVNELTAIAARAQDAQLRSADVQQKVVPSSSVDPIADLAELLCAHGWQLARG